MMDQVLYVLGKGSADLLDAFSHIESRRPLWTNDCTPFHEAKEMATYTPSPCPGCFLLRVSTHRLLLLGFHSFWQKIPLDGANPSALFFTSACPTLRFLLSMLSIPGDYEAEMLLLVSYLALGTSRNAKDSARTILLLLQKRSCVCVASILT